jgi:hypothetical protein
MGQDQRSFITLMFVPETWEFDKNDIIWNVICDPIYISSKLKNYEIGYDWLVKLLLKKKIYMKAFETAI